MSQTNLFDFSELDQINLIGSNNGCTVYQVRCPSTACFYALKEITIDLEEKFARHEILHEMELLRDLNHPNIVKCHNILDRNGEAIQVLLEFMDGGSLADRHITSEGHLSNIARQILSGIAYLHGRKVVHSNIKPSNLLIDNPQNNVKIADFGVGKILSQTLNPKDFVGTIRYMSPERIDCGLYDGCAGDIWSFGLSILEIYLGRFPIEVEGQDYLTMLVFAVCMSPPPEAPSSASREFRDFITCCLQREPERRWSALKLLQHPFILQSQVNQ